MGLEAIVYYYVPNKKCSLNFEGVLTEFGAEKYRSKNFAEWNTYNLFSEDKYYIELLEITTKDSFKYLSIRLALCNPENALDKLYELLTCLLEVGKGYIVDSYSKAEIREIDKLNQQLLFDSFIKKREKFHKNYGFFTKAISCDEINKYRAKNITSRSLKLDKNNQRSSKFRVFVKAELLSIYWFKYAILDISDDKIMIVDSLQTLIDKEKNYSICVINREKIVLNDFPIYWLPNKMLIQDLKKHDYEVLDEHNCKKWTLNPKIFKLYLWFILILIILFAGCLITLSIFN